MMRKTIEIDGRPVDLMSTAAIPRLYRIKFQRDVFADVAKLSKAYKAEQERRAENGGDGSMMPPEALFLFENLAYIMAKHANPTTVPDTIDEWLDSFSTFSIYEVLPQIVELWDLNNAQTATPAKK